MNWSALATLFLPLTLVILADRGSLPLRGWLPRTLPALAYLLVALSDRYWHWDVEYSGVWITASLAVAITLVIRSLQTVGMVARLELVASAILLVIGSCLGTELSEHGSLLSGAFGITLGFSAIGLILIRDIEGQLGRRLVSGGDPGVAFLFPSHSGLILLCILLLGSVPGSLLFMIEDLLLHELFVRNPVYCLGVLFVMATSGISLYLAYTEIFCGRSAETVPDSWRREPPRVLRFVLLLFITLGLLPAFFV